MAKSLTITHEVRLVNFDKPLLDPRLINRGLKRAGQVIKEEVQDVIEAEHHDTGQLEASLKPNPVDNKDQSVTVHFKGKRAKVRHRRRKDGTKGGEYRRFNKTVAFFLNYFKGFYNKHEGEIGEEASHAFMEEIKKADRRR